MTLGVPTDLRDYLESLADCAPFADALPSLKGQRICVAFVSDKYSTSYVELASLPTLGVLNGLFREHIAQRDKDCNALIWARLNGSRKSRDVAEVGALVFDFDGAVAAETIEELLAQLGVTYLIHSSYSHGTSDKFRVIIFLREPIPLATFEGVGIGADGYRELYRAAAASIFGPEASSWIDENCCNASRLFYLPARPPHSEARSFIRCRDGHLFDWRPYWTSIEADLEARRSKRSGVTPRQQSTADAKIIELRTHLNFLKPDDYRDWLLGLMVIRNETEASEEGLDLAHEWSASSEKYDPASTDAKWNSLSDEREDKCMLGSLIWRIRQFKSDYLKGPRNFSALSREELDAAYDAM